MCLIKQITALIIIMMIAGCSTSAIKSENDSEFTNGNNDSTYVFTELDSLYSLVDSLIENQNFLLYKIDSLETELSYYDSLPFIDNSFEIPRMYNFAGYEVNLNNERVFEKFEKIFKNEVRAAHRYIPLSGEYFPYFEKVLKEYGIPEDLKYLSIAESMLKPNATSSAKAAGIWQFMPKTGKDYGLIINDYIDERRDVFKSTEAAARLLRDNHNALLNAGIDDWLLAMCAYNAGIGNVMKDVKGQGANCFFNMIMRVEETDYYVYRSIAIKMIFQYQKEIFGNEFELKKPLEESYKQVSLTSKGFHEIKDWAKSQGTTVAEVYEINPWIKISKHKRAKYTPLNKVILPPGTFNVLVPINSIPDEGLMAKVNESLLKVTSSPLDYYIVKRGDNLGRIAKKHGMSVAQLKAMNNLKSDKIKERQKLRVSKNFSSETVAEIQQGSGSEYYTVKQGDTLSQIALMHNVSVDMIKSANNLKSDDIQFNQKLLVKVNNFTYTVKKGDNLSTIANKFSTTAQKIKDANNLKSDRLSIGQKLDILR
ncbi:MAG: LysM peptidoglycan-binding domain-containing protein [Candidatus Delongbacteria bacterium]|nr:LysM peptidoglycan-binding domain-containing protein [Candidatus Delongbacteria bacterium]MCG2761450.1 LysM peptidoglycan-binding domain-containing protein [Candidatus Delongbacteria bacterium]